MHNNHSPSAALPKWLLFLVVAALGLGLAWAQTPTGAIEGTILDPSGAVVPGAKVTVAELATGRSIEATANQLGLYSVRNLLPGNYRIRVEAAGFATKMVENVSVSSGAVVNGNVSLEIGKTGEIISVAAEAVVVDTARQTVDSVVSDREFRDAPLFSRNFLDLAALAPGTYIRDGGSIDPTKEVNYRTVGIAGRSGTGTRVQVDGIDVTDETVGTTVANFSQESVREFQVTRSSLDPSTSLTSSGSINIISQSGGNEVHGTWRWDYYNQDMGARLQYNKESVPFKRNLTGGRVGGPFKKDTLFWVANWERHYQKAQDVHDAPEFPAWTLSQEFPIGVRMTGFKVDWNASSAVRLFAKFHHNWDLATGGSAISPFQNVNWTNTATVGLDYVKSNMTHTYRFGYVNFNNRIQSQELKFKFPLTPNGIAYNISLAGYGAGPNSLAPQATYQDNWQNSYEGSWFHGKHTVRYGLDIRRIILGGFANFAGPLQVVLSYDADTIAQIRRRGGNVQDPMEYPFQDFTVGPANGFFNLPAAHGLPHGGHFVTRTGTFVQDSVKLSRQLTLNLGVRWQYDTGYFASKDVPRDPIMERYVKGAANYPVMPKTLFSPSFGFAWDPVGNGKTVIRGGFYRGYEMNILNNTMFDEFAMLPSGLGPDIYDSTHVTGPDGKVINVDGRHGDGDYSDLGGQALKSVVGTLGLIKAGVDNAYGSYAFDAKKGESALRQLLGVTYGGQIPGDQYKIPYAVQFNLGVQRELKPGTVLSLDYVHNHAVGLPFFLVDFERRRDAATLNVAAARTQLNRVLAGRTVDEWIAANPTRNFSAFGMMSDSIFLGLYPDMNRIRLFSGGFTKYRGLQVSLRGGQRSLGFLKDAGYNVSYALGRGEASAAAGRVEFITNPYDNLKPNSKETFGPNSLDFTHMLSVAGSFTVPGGFRMNSIWTFRTAGAQTLTVPNMGGAISGVQGFYGTDLNGDGGTGTSPRGDVLPGVTAGQFGRKVKSFEELNRIIEAFNSSQSGQLTPHGKALVSAGLFTEAQLKRLGAVVPRIPAVPTGNPNPWHNLLTTDLRLDRPIKLAKWREGLEVIPTLDIYNLFNHAPAALYGGLGGRFGSLNFDYAAAAAGQKASDLDASRHRLNDTRRLMIGVRVNF